MVLSGKHKLLYSNYLYLSNNFEWRLDNEMCMSVNTCASCAVCAQCTWTCYWEVYILERTRTGSWKVNLLEPMQTCSWEVDIVEPMGKHSWVVDILDCMKMRSWKVDILECMYETKSGGHRKSKAKVREFITHSFAFSKIEHRTTHYHSLRTAKKGHNHVIQTLLEATFC